MVRLSLSFTLVLTTLVALPFHVSAWNIPGHMLSGAIAYQILQRESPATIATIRTMLETHPWYETRWKTQLEKLPESERDEILFMLAPRWADDIRTRDEAEHRGPWHYINLPFKPDGEPESVKTKPPETINILQRDNRKRAHSTKRDCPGETSHCANVAISSHWRYPPAATCRAAFLTRVPRRRSRRKSNMYPGCTKAHGAAVAPAVGRVAHVYQ